jgi:glucose-1-phosphate thymidylyltransferase
VKGIVLAGGDGTRLRPLTKVTSKQLLPVYNKPMVLYPIETLVNSGISEILIIIAPNNAGDFLKLLGNGREYNCRITYEIQEKPAGIAQAITIGENFIGNESVALILGDNLYEDDFSAEIKNFKTGAKIFAIKTKEARRFGVVEFDEQMNALSIEEKPEQPKSDFAVTGLYLYDRTCVAKAKTLQPSPRGELEITDLNNLYLQENKMKVAFVNGRWLDCGTFESLFEANELMRMKANRTKLTPTGKKMYNGKLC